MTDDEIKEFLAGLREAHRLLLQRVNTMANQVDRIDRRTRRLAEHLGVKEEQ